jgi:hypothetical protein
MKTRAHEHVPSSRQRKTHNGFRSSSLLQSLVTATIVGGVVASVGIGLFALSGYLQTPWHTAAAVGGVGQVLIVSFLITLVLEQRRRRTIRQTLEHAFLNHHIRNAITQMTLTSYVADTEKQQRLMRDAAERVSQALFRVANSSDLTGLSLEVDLTGMELTRERTAPEKGDKKAS